MARPLTKKDQKGDLYVRPSSVEAKIDGAIGQDWEPLSKRAQITDPNAADFLPRECLVSLIRDAIRSNDQRLATVLMRPLLLRCAANLLKTVPDSAIPNAAEVREDILDSFQMLFTAEAAEDVSMPRERLYRPNHFENASPNPPLGPCWSSGKRRADWPPLLRT